MIMSSVPPGAGGSLDPVGPGYSPPHLLARKSVNGVIHP